MRMRSSFRGATRSIIAVGFLAAALAGCNNEGSTPTRAQQPDNAGDTAYVETGDLAQIRQHGKLRLLIPRRLEGDNLPRSGHAFVESRELAEAFAKEMGLTADIVYVESHDKLIAQLLEGNGDVIVANLTATPERKKRIAFTAPIVLVHEQVVTRADDTDVKKPADLAGRRVAIRRSSSFWKTVQAMRRKHPKIEIEAVPENVDTETILHRVAGGEYDVTVADSNLVAEILAYRDDLRVAFDAARNRLIAWAVRPRATELRSALDAFLSESRVAEVYPSSYHDDLPGIKKRKVLRVLTRNHPATYFLWRGELMGFEYDLVRAFAKEHSLRVEMIVPPTWGDLVTWLKQGKGDMIAASMTITEERKKRGLLFSRPYNYVSEMVVARKNDKIDSKDDLTGRTQVVSPTTSYWTTLQRLKDSGLMFNLEAAPEDWPTDAIIAKVAESEYDLTVADSHLLDLELAWRDDIKGAFALGDPVPLGWAVYSGKPKLRDAFNAFIKKIYRGTFYNITYKKYFKNPRTIRSYVKFRAAQSGQLSPYDKFVRKYSQRYGFDWRFITAQMFQESRFDPKAKSWVGARGLLQVMPRTARELELTNLKDPATGIHAGVKYMAWLRDRFEGKVPATEARWFALAAYNAGYGHVLDARRLAKQQGLNSGRWFENVERSMLLLSKPKYYKRARYGYVRGGQPVHYVREIRTLYDAYTRVAPL